MLISLHGFGDLVCFLTAGYAMIALIAVTLGVRQRAYRGGWQPAVTILKPLCGAEPYLYESLRSFCIQDFFEFQIVFGVRNPHDPALVVAQRLRREFGYLDITIVVSSHSIGSNRKVDNLANMLHAARHDYLVIADSDIRVAPDYLRRVVAPLTVSSVGVVTCLYRARPRTGLWSRLGGLFVEEWFAPSVLVAHLFGSGAFAFGATIGIRRDSLEAIGGFNAVADHLADDYMLGALTRAHGLRTVLSDCVVETLVDETSLAGLIAHEARWMRTVRSVRPRSYCFLFLTCTLPTALLGAVLASGQPLALMLTGAALLFRLALGYVQASVANRSAWSDACLIPARDMLTSYTWLRGLLSHKVQWRNRQYTVGRNGLLHKTGQREAS